MSAQALVKERRSRREQELAFRTRLVLEAAEEVFAEHGFQVASVEDIAQAAEIAIGTLYKHFGNKEALFAALLGYRQEEFLTVAESCTHSDSDARVQLEQFVERTFRYFDDHRAAFRIYLGATNGFPWSIRSSLGEQSFARYQRLLKILESLLAAGMKADKWPDDDPGRLSVAVMGVVNGALTQRHTADAPTELEQDIQLTRRLVFQLIGQEASTRATRHRS